MKKNIMFRRLLLLSTFSASVFLLFGQQINDENYRTYSGVNNNPVQSDWGAINSNLSIITDIGFADGFETPGGENRPNPRTISNTLFDQSDLINDPMGLSDFCWVWGQFIDHDISLTSDGPEYMPIQVPAGDPSFDPFGVGQAIIPMHRSVFKPLTGTNVGNPRRYPNEITAFIDGSGVYGSNEDRALWLRTLEDGKLKVSAGNFLPFNTLGSNFYDDIDPTAPFMANATGISEKIFVAGDVRASENALLLSFHILFMREHNRQCDLLKASHPDWSDEQLYQYARKIVGGLIQSIMYDEWMPAVGIDLPEYNGYDSSVNPQLSNVFTTAAYRVGHTLLSSTLLRLGPNGNVITEGNLTLQEAFFNPFTILEIGTIDPYLKGMAVQTQQEMDAKVVSDVRNFLFGQPGFGGLDLASININRGRERGLSDYNTIRQNVGLGTVSFFQQINTESTVFGRLQSLYANINQIDPWVGMLAETPVPGSIFGRTIHTILSDQFLKLRDGDRFYYWNDPVLTIEEKVYIQNTTLRDVIMYNTDITLMQNDVFGALPHEEICQNMTLNLSGLVRNELGEPTPDVSLSLASNDDLITYTTTVNGEYDFQEAPFCEIDLLIPERNDNILNGVSTFDIILIQKHILAVELLDSPYKKIAADVNNSGSITTIDLIRLRKTILGIETEFVGNTSWRFILANYEFPEGVDPLSLDFPEFLDFSSENAADLNSGFIAVKVGDVNTSASNVQNLAQSRTISTNNQTLTDDIQEGLNVTYPKMSLEAGKTYTLPIQLSPNFDLEGFQFELELNGLDIIDVETDLETEFFALNNDRLRVSWSSSNDKQPFEQKTIHLKVKALKGSPINEAIGIDEIFSSESYGYNGEIYSIQMNGISVGEELIVKQNQPNPFVDDTDISFYVPESDIITLMVINLSGRIVWQNTVKYEKGWHKWVINRTILPAQGYYLYQLKSSKMTVSRSMIVQ